jgi:hypothetical protein
MLSRDTLLQESNVLESTLAAAEAAEVAEPPTKKRALNATTPHTILNFNS